MNRTYQNLKLLIDAGRYEEDDMYNKLDLFFAVGRINSDEYIELTGLIGSEEEPVIDEKDEEDAGLEETEAE